MKETLEYLRKILNEAKEALESYQEAENAEECSVHMERLQQSIQEAIDAIEIQLGD